MDIDRPEVVAEVRAAFDRYEAALMANDVAVLDELFWASPKTVRYGPTESLYGQDDIQAFRKARDASAIARTLTQVWITTYGTDFATAFAEYTRVNTGKAGKQTQTWMRTEDGWKVVAAHVSVAPGS